MTINLHPWQAEAIEEVRQHIRSGKTNIMFASATGSGKTICASYLIAECHRKGKRAVFVCDRVPLIQQTSDRFLEFGIPHGVIQAKHERTDPDANIQVASAQTLARRGWPDDLSLIVVDEAHSQYTNTLRRISKRNCITVGLSATPFSRGLGKYYDAVVNVRTLDQLTADGYLAPFDVYAPSAPDMTGVKVGWDGEWNEKETSQRAMQVVGDCVAEYAEKGGGKKAICFGVDVSHCEELQRQFLNAGIHAALYTYQTGDAQRAMMMEEFRKPDSFIRVMISVSALAKGLDVPDIGVVIMARPLRKSLTEHIQILGRGLRTDPADPSKRAIILDHASNCERFYPQTLAFFSEGVTELDDGKPKPAKTPTDKPPIEPYKCPKCSHLHKPMKACPKCGHEYPRKQTGVQHVAGKLSAFTGRPEGTREDRQSFYSQLVAICQAKGWDPGSAKHRYRDRFGEWPDGLSSEPAPPTAKTYAWVQGAVIRYHKSKKVKR